MKIELGHHIQATGHLLAYYHSDLLYVRDFQRHKEKPLSDYANGNFRRFIGEFQVARCLDKKREDRFTELLALTLKWIKRTPDDVDGFVCALKKTGLTHNENATALVSKILFLNSPQTIPPFDSRVVTAAWQIGQRKIKNYRDYSAFFNEFKSDNLDEIECRLACVEDYLQVLESDFKGEIENLGAIRQNRYTDKLLWILGSRQ